MLRSPVSLVRPRLGAHPRYRGALSLLRGDASQDAMAVLVVEERSAFASMLSGTLSAAGMDVVRTTSMAEVGRERIGRGVDLLMLNVDRTDEASWLRAAEYRRIHPEVRVWAYTSWPSPVDVTLADFVPAEVLVYYDGNSCDLADRIVICLAAYRRRTNIVTRICPPAAVA